MFTLLEHVPIAPPGSEGDGSELVEGVGEVGDVLGAVLPPSVGRGSGDRLPEGLEVPLGLGEVAPPICPSLGGVCATKRSASNINASPAASLRRERLVRSVVASPSRRTSGISPPTRSHP